MSDNQPPLRIQVSDQPVVLGRSSEASIRFMNPRVSRLHITIERIGDKLSITDHDTRFGTFLNGMKLRNAMASVGDRLQLGTDIIYRVVSDGLRLDLNGQGLSINSSGIEIVRGGRTLVRGIGFSIDADSFVGLLAPSGAGKSTILNCLAGYLQPQVGKLIFEGNRDAFQEITAYRETLGYVTQDDVIFPTLTVDENLRFAARLRIGWKESAPDVASAIDRALARVDLSSKRDSKAGELSGGQRKRLSVAIELLKRPRLLLLDEPTSGLDPASEANIMERLRQVAKQGTTVVCTTHLMDSMRWFDRLVVLGLKDKVGRIAYVGPSEGLLSYFECHSFADLYDRLEQGDFKPLEKCDADLPSPNEKLTSSLPPLSNESTSSTHKVAVNNDSQGNDALKSLLEASRRTVSEIQTSESLHQTKLLSERMATIHYRDKMVVATMAAQPLVLGGLVCLTQYRYSAFRSVLFFAVVIAIWLGLNNSIRDLVRERKHYLRDHLAGLNSNAYLISKAVVFGAIGMLQLLILLMVLGIGRLTLLGVDTASALSKTSFTWLFMILILSYFGGIAIGLICSAISKTEAAAVAMLPLLIMPQLLISAVAAGLADESYNKQRPFRPLVATVTDFKNAPDEIVPWVVDFLSMTCISRPATLAAESPYISGYWPTIWCIDLLHLFLIIAIAWFLVFKVFRRSEQRWLRLLDLE